MAAINTLTPFLTSDVTILVPTMNRPTKLAKLFDSIAAQTEFAGRVIVVDGAENAESVVATFAHQLPIEYHQCRPAGQIRQRNYGLAQLGARDRLVALLDDDIVLEPDALAAMVRFWNTAPPDTAGVGFNIVNVPSERYSPLRAALGLSAREPGRVLLSGATTANTRVTHDVRVEWLAGGATVWCKEVLQTRSHQEISARWAIGEDLIFSYPIGRQRPLYVCAAAQAHHEHVPDYGSKRQDYYHGRTQTVWMYHFVASNKELSRALFLATLLIRMAGKVARGFVRKDRRSFQFVSGQVSALAAIAGSAVRGKKTVELLHESGEMTKRRCD
jgi:glycosyltransferase involved in cell wall biosynthesis